MYAFIPTVPNPSSSNCTAAVTSHKVITPLPSTSSSVAAFALGTGCAPAPWSSPSVAPHAPLERCVDLPCAKPDGRGARPSRILLLFHDDLRVYDNVALATAVADASRVAGTGALVPAVLSSSSSSSSSSSLGGGRHARFVEDLGRQIASLGSQLLHLGDAKAVSDVIRRGDLDGVYMNHAGRGDVAKAQQRLINYVKQHHRNVEAPQALPALPPPIAAAFHSVRSSNAVANSPAAPHPSPLDDALNALQNIDRRRETIALDKTPDVAVVVKPFLDHGVLSAQLVAKHVHRAMGALKGRTFCELVWRTYVCLGANAAAGVRSVQRHAAMA